jgi:hypothetical protein
MITVIDLSADSDNEVDSNGELTHASMTQDPKQSLPPAFTVCSAVMVEVWLGEAPSAYMFDMLGADGDSWLGLKFDSGSTFTDFLVMVGSNIFTVPHKGPAMFPHQWTRACLSVDPGPGKTGRIRLVVDGQVMEDRVHEDMDGPDEYSGTPPVNVTMLLGTNSWFLNEGDGKFTDVNVFSSVLSIDQMVRQTTAGSKECGAPGDYLSWEEMTWELHSKARMETVSVSKEGPCRAVSQLQVYYAGDHGDCMHHCQKVGGGRSPPMRTQQEWETMQRELKKVTAPADLSSMGDELWLAATDEEEETVWRDWQGEEIGEEIGSWMHNFWTYDTNDTDYETEYQCLELLTFGGLDEVDCEWENRLCACQPSRPPHLTLRGLPASLSLDTRYTPRQLAWDPADLFFAGQFTSQIRYTTGGQWVLSDAMSGLTGVSNAPQESYALGKHTWRISNNGLYSYTTQLKLTGCDQEAEFTCADGQCVTMEERCNQLMDCKDESDEKDCRVLVLKNNYNKRVPPVTRGGGSSFNPAFVSISIALMKIVSMEEVQHSIDFQFEITLDWRENRAIFHNLKRESVLNALSEEDIWSLWLPYVIYKNTNMKEAVQLEEGLKTTIVVGREGNLTRNVIEEVDEVEIFYGIENTLTMKQTYTKSFQCKYLLHRYPFDTQVTLIMITFHIMYLSRGAQLRWQWGLWMWKQ